MHVFWALAALNYAVIFFFIKKIKNNRVFTWEYKRVNSYFSLCKRIAINPSSVHVINLFSINYSLTIRQSLASCINWKQVAVFAWLEVKNLKTIWIKTFMKFVTCVSFHINFFRLAQICQNIFPLAGFWLNSKKDTYAQYSLSVFLIKCIWISKWPFIHIVIHYINEINCCAYVYNCVCVHVAALKGSSASEFLSWRWLLLL